MLEFVYFSEDTSAPEAGPSSAGAEAASPTTPEPKPIERSVEFRNTEDSMASMVRCLYFADTFIVNGEYSRSH